MDAEPLARFQDEVQRKIQGETLFDDVSRLLFSTDASIYQIKPLGVVFPRHREDMVQIVRTAAKYRIPILARGGGTSLAGQTVTSGVVVDCSKHMNRVLEVHPTRRWARVQPGLVLDNLNDFLRFHGLFFAPDVATSSRATVGGMIGNNSAGVRSVRYGKTVDHVLAVRLLLSTGEELTLERMDAAELRRRCARTGREAELLAVLRRVVDDNRPEILQRYPKVMRRVGGYNLDYLLDEENFNPAQLVVGSEGTLGLVTEATINLEPLPAAKTVCVVFFDQLLKAIDAVPAILRHGPSAVEIMDPHGIRLAQANPTVAQLFSAFLQGQPEALLIVEFSGESETGVREASEGMRRDPDLLQLSYETYQCWDPTEMARVWQVRKHSLGVLLSVRGDAKPLPFIEDAGIPVQHLGAYIREVLEICRRHGRDVAMYAHASVGVIHVRPILNLKQTEDVRIMAAISSETFELVRRYGGSWSGEHGDGLVRSYKNREFFGDKLFAAFREVKSAFDPLGLMNPGKIVELPDMTKNLRVHPGYRTLPLQTHFRFERDRGLAGAIEMCTGVGHCRKTLDGTMCPSYMATRDEEHSTRGRANALRSAIAGDLGPDGFTSRRLYDVMDLCLECKACKSECPSNVDMARLKAEFLAHYHEANGLSLGKRLFAGARGAAEAGSRFPSLANFVVQSDPVRRLLERFAGIDRRRPLPRLAPTTFARAIRSRPASTGGGAPVLLFVDTFVNFFEPRIGLAAMTVLAALGCDPIPVEAGCCQRPMISAGLLGQVKERGGRLIERLGALAPRDAPIVVLEPSCHSALVDDYPDLIDDAATARQVASRTILLEDFLIRPEIYAKLRAAVRRSGLDILLHGHCQQKALFGNAKTVQVLAAARETRIVEVDSGCCGMAGSFGYEKSHYGVSQKIGNRKLFPAVKKTDSETLVVASGFSCRAQIQHFTGRRALHLAEVLALMLEGD